MALPLKGLRVLDLTKDFAGPFCTMILSNLGAEVIKIEKPGTGDETRSWGPPFVNGLSAYFLSLNRGKKSITLNLKSPEAQKILRQLVVDSDILVESFQPGKMREFGLDYAALRRVNKALAYCSISGFGQTGPYRNRPGYDIVAVGMSGIMSTTGEKNRPPIRVSVPVADIAAGHYASTAILACLARRLVTGNGEYIDISLYESIVSWLSYLANYYFATGKEPEKMGSAHPSIVPYQAFRCKDQDIVIAVGNDEQWKIFCKTIGLERLLDDNRFSTNPSRVRYRRILIPLISRRLRSKTRGYWQRLFEKYNVPSGPVLKVADVAKNPQLKQRGFFRTSKGTLTELGSPIRFKDFKRQSPTKAPRLGEHTRQILMGLGYSRRSIEKLEATNAISVSKE